MNANVVVIGGGITGLAAAQSVMTRAGRGSVTLIEATSRLGGKILTERTDGFVFEGGPDCFLSSKRGGVELCERLGLASRLIGTSPVQRRSFVKRGVRLYPLPEGITGLVPSRLMPLITSGILSLRGRARVALEPFIRGSTEPDESVAAFVRRRFGREAWDWLVEPLLSGIYAGDGDALSLMATFPQLRDAERTYGSLLHPMLGDLPVAQSVMNQPTLPRGFVTLPGGLDELVAALTAQLTSERVLLGARVAFLTRADHGYRVTLGDGTTVMAPAVILATPAHEAATVLDSLDGRLAQELRDIPFVSTATVSVGYPRTSIPALFDGYGYLCPRAGGGLTVACTWTSNKFADRAPNDAVLLRCFIGRAGADASVNAPNETLVAIVRDELRRVHGITDEPRIVRIARWPRALPQYNLGHTDRITRIFKRVGSHPGLFLCGASYRGVGIPDCVVSAWSAAEAATRGSPADGTPAAGGLVS